MKHPGPSQPQLHTLVASFANGFMPLAFFIFNWSYFSMATAPKIPRKKKAVKEVDPNAPPAPPKVKRTRKVAAEPRIKLYWGVFNQNLKRVAVFEYEDLKKAEKHVK